MIIEEAIEIKERELLARSHFLDSKLRHADKLSIEALKRVSYDRKRFYTVNLEPLPGETTE